MNENVAWDEGNNNMFAWWMLVSYLIIGVLLNALQLIIHYFIKELNEQPVCRIILWLSGIDLTFDLICLIQCSLNIYAKSFFGKSTFCDMQATWAEFLMMMSGLSIGSIMFSIYLVITKGRYLEKSEIDKLHGLFAIYCLILTILGTIYPGKGSLNSSGIFCYTNYQHLLEGIIFHAFFVGPLISTLCYWSYTVYKKVNAMTENVRKIGIKVDPRPKEVKMAKLMSTYIIALLICFIPFEIAAMYAWITQNKIPPPIWIIASITGHTLTLLSPILYFSLNNYARAIVLNRLGCYTTDFTLQKKCECSITDRDILDLINDPLMYEKLLAYANKRLTPECVCFLKATQGWITLTTGIVSDHYSQPDDKQQQNFLSISNMAIDIYRMYIADYSTNDGIVGDLCINIAYNLRQQIKESLGITVENGKIKCNIIINFNTITIFGKARDEILGLIKNDLFKNINDEEIQTMVDAIIERQKLLQLSGGNMMPFVHMREQKYAELRIAVDKSITSSSHNLEIYQSMRSAVSPSNSGSPENSVIREHKESELRYSRCRSPTEEPFLINLDLQKVLDPANDEKKSIDECPFNVRPIKSLVESPASCTQSPSAGDSLLGEIELQRIQIFPQKMINDREVYSGDPERTPEEDNVYDEGMYVA
jgi:hypothetical protein